MAKFCMYCGRPLEENEVCHCPGAEAAAQAAAKAQEAVPPEAPSVTPAAPVPPEAPVSQAAAPDSAAQDGADASAQPGAGQPSDAGGEPAGPQAAWRVVGADSAGSSSAAQPGPDASPRQAPQRPSAGELFLGAWGSFADAMKRPDDGPAEFAQRGNWQQALILMGMQAAAAGLCAVRAAVYCNGILNSLMQSLYSMIGGMFSYMKASVNPFAAFILTAACSFALSALLALFMLAAAKLEHRPSDYKSALCVSGARSMAVLPVALIALIVSLFSVQAGLLLFFFDVPAVCFTVAACRRFLGEEKSARSVYVTCLSMLLLLLCGLLFARWFGPSLIPAAIREIISDPSQILSLLF